MQPGLYAYLYYNVPTYNLPPQSQLLTMLNCLTLLYMPCKDHMYFLDGYLSFQKNLATFSTPTIHSQ